MTNYTTEIGRKFHADGRVRTFAGNTIICFVPPDSHVFRLAEWVQMQVRSCTFAHKFAFLPPDSFHMTVMELLCDETRNAERWTSALPLDAPLAVTDDYFIKTVPTVAPPAAIRMRFVETTRKSFTINLRPADAETAQALRTYRDGVAAVTGVRAPDHDQYQFHISLAYRLIHLTAAEEAALDQLLTTVDQYLHEHFGHFEPAAPQLTLFDDMFCFATVDERATLRTR